MTIDKAFIREAERIAKFPAESGPMLLELANKLRGGGATRTHRRRRTVKAAPKTVRAKRTRGVRATETVPEVFPSSASSLGARARARLQAGATTETPGE